MRDIPESELEDVFERYGNMVYRLAFAYARSKADADDIFQEVFLRYYRRAPAFQSEEHRKAWLLRVTINRAKSCLSKMPHEPQETADAAPFSAPESLELHEAPPRPAPPKPPARLCRRNRFIINISRDHNRIRPKLLCISDHFLQNVFLIFFHIVMIKMFSDMQIR